jgi:hypothetical protein
MTEASFRGQPITNTQLQDLGFRKAPIVLAIPDDLALVSDLKHTAGAWTQCHFAEIRSEGREEFLGQPRRAEQPLTLRAVGDGDPGRAISIAAPLGTCIDYPMDEAMPVSQW